MAWMYPTLFTICLFIACRGQETSKEKIKMNNSTYGKLANYLMDGYNKAVRPVLNWKQKTTVELDVTLYALLNVDEKNQLISCYLWFNQSWMDEFLSWDPMQFDNVTKISIPAHHVWQPDTTITESLNEEKPREISYVTINNNGKVSQYKPMHVDSACILNIHSFPFDYQNCSLSFASWAYTIEDIDFAYLKIGDAYFPDNLKSEGEWDVRDVISKHVQQQDNGLNYGEVLYFIIIRRRPLFYIVNLIFPSMLLMIMDIVGFYLPPEGGERVSFKVTLLLGYSVFLIVVAEQLPATGMPVIGVYFVLCMIMLVVSLMESILLVRIIHKESLHPEVPKWLKKFILVVVAPLVCLKEWIQFTTPEEDSSSSTEQTGKSTEKLTIYNNENVLDDTRQLQVGQDSELLLNILKEVGSIREHLKKSNQQYVIQEWLQISYIIDKLLFRLYLIILLVSGLSIGCIWARWQVI
ncbi:5-hydroxytryptamine receptor 3A-like [Rana temporaria]|uniref:5-hydroxytryptamine receptor 3A-like n=1 Tax=Rana temporaria TaxID=8407 RepID=UPI001AAD30A3|nr:5-hydroxytryptamine receptor 3A-like [Rana temporaria]